MLCQVLTLIAVATICQAGVNYGGQEDIYHAPKPYHFGYNHITKDGGTVHRQESGDAANNKKGSYGYTGPDGVYRHVNYIADAKGFRASITTNEPGTSNQSPANVKMAATPIHSLGYHGSALKHQHHESPVIGEQHFQGAAYSKDHY